MVHRVLLIEGRTSSGHQLAGQLRADARLRVVRVRDGESALSELGSGGYELLMITSPPSELDGPEFISAVGRLPFPVPVIVMARNASPEDADEALRSGAFDYLAMPVSAEHLRLVVGRALRGWPAAVKREPPPGSHRRQNDHPILVSQSPRMHAVFDLIRDLAETTSTVLIEGETGTGKEQIARAIHEASAEYRTGDLVAVNCAALPENLLESELFGHEKGAFTGAAGQRKGRVELANGGTLFLDEVGDVPPSMQVKLLRVLQERRFERVGGTESVEVDLRVIAATNRSLSRMVKRGKLREDLYYRLNVVKIDLPPLRERQEDIPLLAAHFASRHARRGEAPAEFTPEAAERLLEHGWPGNIRELENVIERACVTSRDGLIGVDRLALEPRRPPRGPGLVIDLSRPLAEYTREIVAQVEQHYIRKALRRTRGHVGRCASLCGLSRRCITNKLAEYRIRKSEFKEE